MSYLSLISFQLSTDGFQSVHISLIDILVPNPVPNSDPNSVPNSKDRYPRISHRIWLNRQYNYRDMLKFPAATTRIL